MKPIINNNTAWLFVFIPALSYFVSTRLRSSPSIGLFRSSTYGRVVPSTVQLENFQPSSPDDVDGNGIRTNIRDFFGGKHSPIDLQLYSSEETINITSGGDLNGDGRKVSPRTSSSVGGSVEASLRHPIRLVQDDFDSITSTTWREDEELGRGFLLLSTSSSTRTRNGHNGKIFRWETGGGPIAIGRTLHLSDSGCRSGLYRQCNSVGSSGRGDVGSGGIVVDYSADKATTAPRLIVAEYGEGRIVRLEENGARTPIVIGVPPPLPVDDGRHDHEQSHRLVEPIKLLMTPYGDLIILDRRSSSSSLSSSSTIKNNANDVLWRLPRVRTIPALPSLSQSREAHAWQRINQAIVDISPGEKSSSNSNSSSSNNTDTPLPELFFQADSGVVGRLGGMVLDTTGQHLLVTVQQNSSVFVASIALLDDIEVGEDVDSETGNPAKDRRLSSMQSTIVFEYGKYAQTSGAGPIEIDNDGNLYLAVDSGVMIVSSPSSTRSQKTVNRREFPKTGKKFTAIISFDSSSLSSPSQVGTKNAIVVDDADDDQSQNKIIDLTLGSDKYLYISTPSRLFRMKVRNKPLVIDTELLLKA